jgi:hypothetical protein
MYVRKVSNLLFYLVADSSVARDANFANASGADQHLEHLVPNCVGLNTTRFFIIIISS